MVPFSLSSGPLPSTFAACHAMPCSYLSCHHRRLVACCARERISLQLRVPLFAGLLACLPACLHACLPACMLAGQPVCLPARLPALRPARRIPPPARTPHP